MDVAQLASDLIAINSVSQRSNLEITEYLERALQALEFAVERLEYRDANGVAKASLVARKGAGNGGLALLSHSDTVPVEEWDGDPFLPVIRDGRLYGRGSCDMKGPLAATLAAAARFRPSDLRRPLLIVVTADEEISGAGARSVLCDSTLLDAAETRYGVVAEPTRLVPVYAHKGSARIIVTAHGRSGHSSTDEGISANFIIAPFLAEMAALDRQFKTEEQYLNRAFDPPSNGWNMVLNDGNTAPNVTAAKSVCTITFRPMPGDPSDEILRIVQEKAAAFDLECAVDKWEPFLASRDSEVMTAALAATRQRAPATASFGTEAITFRSRLELVILGPGDIRQAHTANEWICLRQLHEAVEVYEAMIERLCSENGR
jgi:acetylornithine deacetylase